MSFGGGGTNTHTEETRVLSLHVNQSAYGVGKARVWGKQRVSANMLWFGDWKAIPHTETTTTSSGGKGGGGSSSSSNTTYTYTAGLVLALCAGPIAGVGKVWEEKNLTDLPTLGYTLKTGELRQAPWSHLVANYPAQAVSYSGIAYVANNALDLGTSSSQPSVSFEVFGERLIPGGDDAHPADVIYDIVADPLEGVGLPSSLIANAADYALWCEAKGLVVSLAATTQSASRDWIAQVLKATLAEAIWSNGQIKLIPYGDEPVGAWSPVTSPDYDLTEADLLEAPRHRRKQPADATNRVTLNYTSRAKDYNTSTITRDDLSAVTQYGVRPETLDLLCITSEAQAAVVCEFWRDRNLYIRNEWEIDVDERFCLVESMDLLTLTFAPQGLYRQPVRVVEVSDDGSGTITLLVEEWPFGLLSATVVPTQPISGYVPEYNVAPGATNTPVIFEAPNALTAPNLEIWIGASGGQHWGGARVWVSDDNSSYQQIGVISSPARHGVLTSLLAAGSDPDLTHSLYLNMAASHGQLLSGTRADADNGNTISWVDGEIIAYETAELVDTDKYALSYLRRGQKGTVSAGHLTGSQFLRLDDAVFKYRVPRERIGSPVWIKLQSFNKYGRSPEPLDTVEANLYTIAGNKPLPLTSLTATGGLFEISLAWTTTPGQIGIDYVEIWVSGTNNRSSAHNLTSQKHPVSRWTHNGLQPGDSWFYWGRVIDTSGNASEFFPISTTGGVGAEAISDPTLLLDMLQNALGMPQLAAELAEPIALIPELVSEMAAATTAVETAVDAASSAASMVSNVQARLDSGDFSAVKTSASASAGALTGVLAKYGIQTQTIQNGVTVVAGIELLSGAGGSAFAVLADKFLFYQPNGQGAPKQVFTMGTVNGVTAFGFDGSAIFDGSLTARQINGTGLKISGNGEINVGAYIGYAWPAPGNYGAHLSASGLLIGNANNNTYVQVSSDGNLYTPAINIINGVFTIRNPSTGAVILSSGAALNPAYAAAGTVNSDLIPSINSAATTAHWNAVADTGGKPANYADVTGQNTAAAIAGQGAFATINRITTYIADAYMDSLSVAGAKITGVQFGSVYLGANGSVWIPTVGGRYPLVGALNVICGAAAGIQSPDAGVALSIGGFTLTNRSSESTFNAGGDYGYWVTSPIPATIYYAYL